MQKIEISKLKPYKRNPRVHSERQIDLIAQSIKNFGFTAPILIDENNTVLSGHGRLAAAKKLHLSKVPVRIIKNLSEHQKKAYVIADNKLAEKSSWDKDLLSIEIEDMVLNDPDFDISLTGFETAEIDLLLHKEDKNEVLDEPISSKIPQIVKKGQVWQLGPHKIICANALDKSTYEYLLGNEKAVAVISDPPFNVPVEGHICGKGKTKHKEFAMASGEMSRKEFRSFMEKSFENFKEFSKDGSLHYHFIDWRSVADMCVVGRKIYAGLKNICVWDKTSGGMGSLYRSQHELVCVFKNGKESHINNIQLGEHGRYRTNVWSYPGIFVNSKLNRENIKLHPTVKPVGLLADIILDCTKRGDVVLDGFGGSGSTLLAAERTKRIARLIEIDPHYCDVTLYRFERITGIKPHLIEEEEI